MDEQNATPEGGASVLDRLEQKLSAPTAPANQQEARQPQQAEEQPAQADTPEVDPDEDGQQDNGPQLTTSDLAKVLGIDETLLDVDSDGTVKLKTKIDGAEGAAKLADLLKSYQLEGHVNKKSMEVAEREKALQTQAQQAESLAQARLQHVEQLATVAAKELYKEFNSIDWNALEQADPGQAALMRQKFQDRQAQLQNVFNEVEQSKAKQAQQSQAQFRQVLEQEAAKLPTMIPEWKDEAVATKERTELREWAIKAGVPADEVNNVAFAHHVAILRKAMLYDKLQSSKPALENKVRTAPKLVKPGQAEQTTQAQTAKNLRQTVIKSGGKQDAIAQYLLASGKA